MNSFFFSLEGREALRLEIGIDETTAVGKFREKLSGEGRFSCSVGTGNDDAGGGGMSFLIS